MTGNDAGEEAAFGHGPEAVDRDAAHAERERERTDPDRAYRPSTTGRTGPDTWTSSMRIGRMRSP